VPYVGILSELLSRYISKDFSFAVKVLTDLAVSRVGRVGNIRTNAGPCRMSGTRGSITVKVLCYKPKVACSE
jgi:hypothetical protein